MATKKKDQPEVEPDVIVVAPEPEPAPLPEQPEHRLLDVPYQGEPYELENPDGHMMTDE